MTDYNEDVCSSFVHESIIPLLGQYPAAYVDTKQKVAEKFNDWLSVYRESGCMICVDYYTDWELTVDLLTMIPDINIEFIKKEMIWTDLDQQKIENYWKETGLPRHMALYDARANRFGYDEQNRY